MPRWTLKVTDDLMAFGGRQAGQVRSGSAGGDSSAVRRWWGSVHITKESENFREKKEKEKMEQMFAKVKEKKVTCRG